MSATIDMEDMMSLVEQMVNSTNSNSLFPFPNLSTLSNLSKSLQPATAPSTPRNEPSNQSDLSNPTESSEQQQTSTLEGEPDTILNETTESICFPETEQQQFSQEVDNQLSKSFQIEYLSNQQLSFIHSSKTILVILIVNSLFASVYHQDLYSLCSLVLNIVLLLFFSQNEYAFAMSMNNTFQNASKQLCNVTLYCWNKSRTFCNSIFSKLLNRVISKKNQLIFGFVFNMLKQKTKNRFIQMKHNFFNPPILKECKSFTTYKLNYSLNGQRYTIPIVNPRSEHYSNDNSVLMVLDENGNDITNSIQCYLGPRSNFHGLRLSPSEIGLGNVTVLTNDGVEHSVKSSDHFPQ